MEDKILALAKALGHGQNQDDETLRVLCAAAERELAGRLRQGIVAADCESAFVLAAAWLALAATCVDPGGPERVTAGSLTIQERSGKDGLDRSAGLRRQAEQTMAPYLRDPAFSFVGVRG